MSEILGKVIYIPSVYDGKKYGYPEIIFVSGYSETSILGSRDPAQIEAGKRKFFSRKRCIPFSPNIWDVCEQLIKERKALEKSYKELEKLANKTLRLNKDIKK